MRRVMRKPCELMELNDSLDILPREKANDKVRYKLFNEILLKSMSNIYIRQEYVQGFDFEAVDLKKDINMFECM